MLYRFAQDRIKRERQAGYGKAQAQPMTGQSLSLVVNGTQQQDFIS